MLAIPSPDLLVNLFASGAQVLGLLTVAFGGIFASRRRHAATAPNSRPAASRWPFLVTLALLIAVSVAFAFHVLATNDANNKRLQTNLVRKSVEGGKKVGDTSLKTLAFSEQHKHKRALATETIATWVAEKKDVNLIDVREPEEIEMGQIAGSWARRFPDLKIHRENLVRAGVPTVLLCDSGNRSSELSDLFHKDGIETFFMIGGFEKWVSERRPLLNAGKRTDIRDIPDYPNKLTLLDTPEVERLVREENAVFVDVRYPEEFATGALPGAVNLTLRKLLQEEIEPAIRALPNRPVIVPCYDKRSSFFGMLLGLRMHRLGLDFRGRYTVPHEYFAPPPTPQHIAAWQADQAQHTAFSLAAGAVGVELEAAGHGLGSLVLAILLAVLLVRVVLLPFTLKADRDQLKLRGLAPGIVALRQRHAGDPLRLRREILALHRGARLTPVRNLVGTLVLLVAFLLLFAAVDVAAAGHRTPFLWLPGLGSPDPLHVLPVAVGALFFVLIVAFAARTSALRLAGAALLGGVVAAALWSASAAASIYLVFSLGTIVAQRALFQWWWQRRESRALGTPAGRAPEVTAERPCVALALAQHVPAAGRKARRLAQLLAAGFPVPAGFVVCHEQALAGTAGRRAIERAFRRLGAARVAVRSSGVAEDGADQSHAGEFDSLLQVEAAGLADAIRQVQDSLAAPRSQDARRQDSGGVLVQAMVPAEHSGVLFTEDPNCTGAMLVETTRGLGDQLVSGRVDPDAFRFGRRSLQPLQAGQPPIDLSPLLALGRRAEQLFGRPQDIEWAYAGGRFFVLQSRDITTTAHGANPSDPSALCEAERRRLLALAATDRAGEVVFAQNELSELMPEPTPYSLALMNQLWAADGAVDRAARRLGVPYQVADDAPPYAVAAFGRLYVSRQQERERFGRGLGALATLRLTRGAKAIERDFRESFLPRFRTEIRVREAVDPKRLSLHELVLACEDLRQRFVRETYVEAEVINLASTFYTQIARKRLQRAGLDPAELLGQRDASVLPRAIARLRLCDTDPYASFLAELGHRAPHDFELSQPRYAEARDEMTRLIAAARDGADAVRTQSTPATAVGRVNAVALANADRFEGLKEEAKHETLRELACLRALLLELGHRLGVDAGVFWLLPEEVSACEHVERAELQARIAARRASHHALAAGELPPELTLADLETVFSPLAAKPEIRDAAAADAPLHGIRVAGSGDVVGRACVVRDPADARAFADGDVLIARFTDPRWLPLFRRARGLVAEVGGWLSHAAIQARELRLPAIVGVRGATTRLQTGDVVCLRRDGTIENLADRRQHTREPVEREVRVDDGETVRAGRMTDVSATGMVVQDLEGVINVGRIVRVELDGVAVPATVVRADAMGVGIQFDVPLARKPTPRIAAG